MREGGFSVAQQRLTTLMFSPSAPHDGSREDFRLSSANEDTD